MADHSAPDDATTAAGGTRPRATGGTPHDEQAPPAGETEDPSTSNAPARRPREYIRLAPVSPEPPVADRAGPPGVDPPPVLVGNPALPSDPGRFPVTPAPVTDSVVDGATLANLLVRAASIRGDEHRYYADPRQDAMGFWFLDRQGRPAGDGILVACVADGLGSKPLSQVGSAAACQALRDEVAAGIASLLDEDDPDTLTERCQSVLDRVADRIRERAVDHGVPADQLSTTLVGAVVHETADGWRALLLRVGDSTAFVLDTDGFRPCWPEPADDGEFYSTATRALPDDMGRVSVTVTYPRAGDLLLLCSDGLANPMRAAEVSGRLRQWWTAPRVPSLPEFYWQLSFRARSYGDDRSAVCAWFR